MNWTRDDAMWHDVIEEDLKHHMKAEYKQASDTERYIRKTKRAMKEMKVNDGVEMTMNWKVSAKDETRRSAGREY